MSKEPTVPLASVVVDPDDPDDVLTARQARVMLPGNIGRTMLMSVVSGHIAAGQPGTTSGCTMSEKFPLGVLFLSPNCKGEM